MQWMCYGGIQKGSTMLRQFVEVFLTVVFLAGVLSTMYPQEAKPNAAEPIAHGWRGNGTGLWPDARPPMEWYRIPKGVLAGLRASADRPGGKAAAHGVRLEKG